MKPIFQRFLLLAVLLSACLPARADFKYKDLYYSVTSEGEKTVQLVRPKSEDYNFTEVTIPSVVEYDGEEYTVTSIGYMALCRIRTLTKVEIPPTVISIGEFAFGECFGITSIEIPSSVVELGDKAVAYTGIKTFSIGSSVKKVGTALCSGCSSLTEISVDANNTCYASVDGGLYDKAVSKLISVPGGKTSVEIPNTVVEICTGAFEGCFGFSSVELPSSVTTLDDEAFYLCGIESLTIGSSVANLSNKVFGDMSYLKNIYVDESNPLYTSVDGVVYNKDVSALVVCPRERLSVEIPSSVEEIVDSAFYHCSNIPSIDLTPVKKIGSLAFCDCSNLASVTAPSATAIGKSAFSGCTNLTSISLPSIAEFAYAFGGSSLNDIDVGDSNPLYTSIDGALYSKDVTALAAFPPGRNSAEIPSSVEDIVEAAFYSCGNLTSIDIPSVKKIGNNAFERCKNIISATRLFHLKSLGDILRFHIL